MTPMKRAALATISLAALLALNPLTLHALAQPAKQAAADDSGTMQRADKDMKRVLAKLQELGAKPIGTQSVEVTRKGPTPADAVKAVLKDEGRDPAALMAQMKVAKKDMTYPTGGGSQTVRIYTPEDAGEWPLPVIVYYHGGGWVIADLDTYESSAMALAHKAKAIVASVEYRHAPENKFPAAHEDAFAAYRWVLENAGQFRGDAKRVAVAGESAGGNLALNVAIAARDQKVQEPVHMLLVYPVAGTDTDTRSYQKNTHAMPLSKQAMEWFVQNTVSRPEDKQDPRLDLVGQANLKDLPPATVIAAEIDPLMSEGKTLSDKLKQAGGDSSYHAYEGVTHEFFGMDAVVADAKKAQDVAAKDLREAFSSKATGSTRSGAAKQ
ncbi:MAG TPA: alpha/beta hydrolase [Beijerinckiaceae bacterium]|nr:alpha/beta hydrolase [Beijerinckiaceae bacterium]